MHTWLSAFNVLLGIGLFAVFTWAATQGFAGRADAVLTACFGAIAVLLGLQYRARLDRLPEEAREIVNPTRLVLLGIALLLGGTAQLLFRWGVYVTLVLWFVAWWLSRRRGEPEIQRYFRPAALFAVGAFVAGFLLSR